MSRYVRFFEEVAIADVPLVLELEGRLGRAPGVGQPVAVMA